MALTKWIALLQWFSVLATVVLTAVSVWRRPLREPPLFHLPVAAFG